jgi:hypothetical protein
MTVQTRPTGITILAVLSAVGGVLALLAGIALVTLTGVVASASGLGGFVAIAGLLLILTGILDLAFAYGAWTLQPWAWILGIASAILSIVSALLRVVDNNGSISSAILSIAISAAILYYLNTPAVKAAFGKA